jgi:hypothetical protein
MILGYESVIEGKCLINARVCVCVCVCVSQWKLFVQNLFTNRRRYIRYSNVIYTLEKVLLSNKEE